MNFVKKVIKRIQRVLNTIIAPVRKYPISFVFFSCLLIFPETTWIYSSVPFYLVPKYLLSTFVEFCFNNLMITTAIAYLLVAVPYIFCKIYNRLGTVALLLSHLFVYVAVFTELYLKMFFGTGITAMMIKLLCETHSKEATDFVTSYLLNPQFLLFAFSIVCVIFAEWGMMIFYNKFKFKKLSLLKDPLALYIILAVSYFIYLRPVFSTDWRQNYIFIEENRLPLCSPNTERSFLWSLNLAIVQYVYEKGEKDLSVLSQSKIGTASVEPGNIPNVILIIGESFNRHHASTYGYPIPTCSFTDSVPGVCAYTDVITSYNVTADALHNTFSVANVADTMRWCDAPFFPGVFKNAGFNVVFWSNHYIYETTTMSNGNFSGNFFTHPVIREKCFSFYNKEKRQYDSEYLDYYKAKRDSVEKETNNLIFIHLAGQHVDPVNHFPPERTVFTKKDYAYRTELNDEEKQQVANYDNCTLYVDSVVAEIFRMYENKDAVVIYMPDHGDEANDYQSHIGRSYNLEVLGAPCLHCQFDIPFLVYMSPICREKHPEKYEQIINAKDKPFMTDDMPHLLFDLAGIRSPWFHPELSPLSNKYDTKKKRIVSASVDYDSICSAYGPWKVGFKK